MYKHNHLIQLFVVDSDGFRQFPLAQEHNSGSTIASIPLEEGAASIPHEGRQVVTSFLIPDTSTLISGSTNKLINSKQTEIQNFTNQLDLLIHCKN